MHVRDRLRTAFLRKRASQVCWRCALSPRHQFRSVQTVPASGLDDGAPPTELELLLGNAQRGPHDDVPVSNPSARSQVDNSPEIGGRTPSRTIHEEALDPAAPKIVPPIRRRQGIHPTIDSVRPWSRRPALIDAGWTLGTLKKDPAVTSKSRHSRRQQRPSSTAVQDTDTPYHLSPQIGEGLRLSTAAITAKRARGRQAPARKKPINDLRGRVIRRVCIGIGSSTLPVYATIDKPIYQGPRYHRFYLFRGLHGNVIRVDYSVPIFVWYLDGLRDARTEARNSSGHDGQTLEETEELFLDWLGSSEPSPRCTRDPVAQQDHHSTTRAHKLRRSSTRSTFAREKPLLSLRDGNPPTPSSSATNSTQLHPSTPGQSAAWHIANDPRPRGPLGMPNRRPTLGNQDLTNADVLAPSQAYTARLHTRTDMRVLVEGRLNPPLDAGVPPPLPSVQEVGIRQHLRMWQELQDAPIAAPLPDPHGFQKPDSAENTRDRSIEKEPDIVQDPCDPALCRDWGLISSSSKDEETEEDVYSFLRPGDIVSFMMKTGAMLAVFIRNFQFQSQFYSMQGKWFHMSTRQVSFYIPKLFTQQDIDPLMPYLPNKEVESEALHKLQEMDKGVPREIGAPLIEKLQSLHSASDEVYREHAERIDRVHALVAHESRTTEITLLDIAMVVLQKQNVNDLTNIMLWTVHKALIRNPNFRPQPGSTHRGHPLWIVNPVRMMRGFEQVKAWLREYLEGQIAQATSPDASSTVVFNEKDSQSSNPVPSFLRKAKRLVESSRASRNITAYAGLGPLTDRSATDEPPLHHAKSLTAFTIFEMEIIRYLKSWCLSWDIPTAGSVWALGPLLLGATESYEGRTLDEKTAFLFLQEMGIIAPWENRYVYERNVRFPKHDNSSEIAETRVVGSLSQQRETRRGGSLENSLEDSLEGLRKDWGDLPVYCIDDASAREIDDGISLERLNGEDSIFWIHIHVANPSAFIGPDSGISRYAADLLETTYLPEKVYPMLNSTLTESYFSLANHRPVLTLSAKVNVDGEILATDITPGWIHNTKKITPTRLDRQLGSDGDPPSKPSQMLQVGRPMDFERRNAAEDQLSHSELAELRTLHELGIARRIKRSGGEGITQFSHGTVPNPLVYLDKGGIIPMFNPRLGRQFICDPSIAWEACEADVTGELALGRTQNFVADIMLIAGEVAGRWCAERGMPIVYRGTIRDPAPRLNLENYKKNTIDYSMRVKGYVPTRFYRELNRALGQSVGRSVPFPHAVLRTEVYTKATSPLRRYPDLLNHWQIQAALLHEARHGKGSLIGSTDDSYLPFSRSKLDAMIPGIELRQLVMKHLTKQSKVHWIMQLLHRAFHFKEAVLPELFDVLVHIEPRTLLKEGNAVGYTRQLSGLDADLVENDTTKREGGIRMGDRWQCKMDGVDTYAARLKMWPLKLMEREVWGVAIPATGAA